MKSDIRQHDARQPWFLESESVDMVFTSPPFWRQRKYGELYAELGREDTLEQWVQAQVSVFREARRVLRPWGTLWVELGDKRASNVRGRQGAFYRGGKGMDQSESGVPPGAMLGELMGAPAAFAEAMRHDGWCLRSDIIWHKPDAQPETLRGWAWERCRVKTKGGRLMGGPNRKDESGKGSRTDIETAEWAECNGCEKCRSNGGLVLRKGCWRPTTAHTVVYMFSKGPSYYMDQYAMLEETTGNTAPGRQGGGRKPAERAVAGRNNPSWAASRSSAVEKRNARTVQSILKGQFSGAKYGMETDHHAGFPEALPAWAIRGATSEKGNCPACGMPWVRVVERSYRGSDIRIAGINATSKQGTGTTGAMTWQSLGFRPSCTCCAGEPVPAVVLDPYGGAMTTLLAAERLGRHGIGFDLYEKYVELGRRRLEIELVGDRAMRGQNVPTVADPDHIQLSLYRKVSEGGGI